MASFNEFVELELPKRPFAETDAPAPGYVAVRDDNMLAPRKMKWVAPESIGTPSYVEMTAAMPLSGQRVIAAGPDGKAVYADSADATLANCVVGVSVGAADADTIVRVQVSNEMVEPGWSWTPGAVYVGTDGVPTQVVPTAGFSMVIGVATTPSTLVINKQLPIIKL